MHQITYIESNGTQCINTGIKLYDSSPVNYKIDVKFIGYSTGTDLGVYINAMREVSPYPGTVLRKGTINGTACV